MQRDNHTDRKGSEVFVALCRFLEDFADDDVFCELYERFLYHNEGIRIIIRLRIFDENEYGVFAEISVDEIFTTLDEAKRFLNAIQRLTTYFNDTVRGNIEDEDIEDDCD